MKQPNNQDGVLAAFRRDTDANDPPFYTARHMLGRRFVWLNVGGNVGWYCPEIRNGEMIGIRSIALPQPQEGETPEDRDALNYQFKLINPKQRRKIVALIPS